MADSKITALTSIGTITDPAVDPLVIVDVSDTSMAATGTTKKVTLNNLLACSPTATLASATITGDLTVKTNVLKVDTTNNRVGVNTASPATDLEVRANGNAEGTIRLYSAIDGSTASPKGSYFSFRSGTTGSGTETARLSSLNRLANVLGGDFSISTADTSNVLQNRLTIDSGGVFTFAVGGSTAMTLNSTGLGVGVAPIERLTVAGTASVGGTGNIGVKFHSGNPVSGNLAWLLSNDSANSNILNLYYYNAGVFSGRAFVVNQSGNFMVRTPSTPPTIPDNEMMVFNLTSNTNLRISVKGTDGTVRTANITLA